VALEALAAALPVVAVASKAAGDLLGQGTGGLLAPEDPEAFARTVVTLWGQPDRCRALGEAGRRTAARYTPEVSAARLLELYQGLLVASRSRALPARAWRSWEVHT
jgi:glycosyltransferase EpsD